jgi:hypothetical protein
LTQAAIMWRLAMAAAVPAPATRIPARPVATDEG